MKKIVLVVFFGLFTSGVVAEERKVVIVSSAEDAEQATPGTILRGRNHSQNDASRLIAHHCDLETVVLWTASVKDVVFWICEKA